MRHGGAIYRTDGRDARAGTHGCDTFWWQRGHERATTAVSGLSGRGLPREMGGCRED